MAARNKAAGTLCDYIRQFMRNRAVGYVGSYTQFCFEVIEYALYNYEPTPLLFSVACGYNKAYKQLTLEGLMLPKCSTKAG